MGTGIGPYVRERRLHLELSQEELADRIGGSHRQSDISRLERGRIGLPRIGTLAKLAAALEVPVGDLLIAAGWFAEQDTLEIILGEIEAELDTLHDMEGSANSRSDRLRAMIRKLKATRTDA